MQYTSKLSDGHVTWMASAVDTLNPGRDLRGLITLLLFLHHFRPWGRRRYSAECTRSAITNLDSGRGWVEINLAESSELSPSVWLIALTLNLFMVAMVLLLTPLVRPFRWSWLLFAYLIPLAPLYILWDGTVSAFRAYTTDELLVLCGGLKGEPSFRWNVGRISGRGSLTTVYLLGYPKLPQT